MKKGTVPVASGPHPTIYIIYINCAPSLAVWWCDNIKCTVTANKWYSSHLPQGGLELPCILTIYVYATGCSKLMYTYQGKTMYCAFVHNQLQVAEWSGRITPGKSHSLVLLYTCFLQEADFYLFVRQSNLTPMKIFEANAGAYMCYRKVATMSSSTLHT